MTNKQRYWFSLIGLTVVFLGGYYRFLCSPVNKPKYFVRIAGLKPTDATIKAWANYWISGDDCQSYSYDMFGKKAHRGGKITTKITRDFSENDEQYELRVPYSSYMDSKNCLVELRDIIVEAYNKFDTVGFAQLHIYQAGNSYNDKPISLSSKIEAKQCDGDVYKGIRKIWVGSIGCYFYVDDKKISTELEYNAENTYFDFSKFNSNTTINFNILAGDNYRHNPIDPQTGK